MSAKKELWNDTKKTVDKVWEKTKEMSSDAWDKTKEMSGKAWDKTKETTEDVKEYEEFSAHKGHQKCESDKEHNSYHSFN